jgi:hypothetical protein
MLCKVSIVGTLNLLSDDDIVANEVDVVLLSPGSKPIHGRTLYVKRLRPRTGEGFGAFLYRCEFRYDQLRSHLASPFAVMLFLGSRPDKYTFDVRAGVR